MSEPSTVASLDAEFAREVEENQLRLRGSLKPAYDFIVCGSGSSGAVVARRLAENPDVSVLLIEAGGSDNVPEVEMAAAWPLNLGSDAGLGFHRPLPNPHLNGRAIPMSMGKVLGGGSSINVMLWARGHKSDWDYFAAEAGDAAWSYDFVLAIYREIENWQGKPDPARRGKDGLLHITPPIEPNPVATAMLDAAVELGIPCLRRCERLDDGRPRRRFLLQPAHPRRPAAVDLPVLYIPADEPAQSHGAVRHARHARAFRRESSNRRRMPPRRPQPPLSRLAGSDPVPGRHPHAEGTDAVRHWRCRNAGIAGIPLVQHLPGVGANFQDHVMVSSCIWEYPEPLPPHDNGGEATIFAKSTPELDSPDIQLLQIQFPVATPELAQRHSVPAGSWGIFPALLRPHSVGRLRLTGAKPEDPILIDSQILSDPADLTALRRCVELAREVGNSQALRRFVKREVMPTRSIPRRWMISSAMA